MIDPQGLVGTARLLLGETNKGAPNQTRLRRAVSTAFYALGNITRSEARDLVDLAEFAITQLKASNVDERRNFLAYLMFSART
jgi:hypothetical protein